MLSACNPLADADNIRIALLSNTRTCLHLKEKVDKGRVLDIYAVVNNYCRNKQASTQRISVDINNKRNVFIAKAVAPIPVAIVMPIGIIAIIILRCC